MPTLALVFTALVLAAPAAREPLDCAREIADARRLFQDQASERLLFAEPLARAVRQVIDRTLTDEDRALIRGFKRGEVPAEALDARLWPKLRRVFARFNAADCRHLGGIAGAEETVDALTSMRGGTGLHTGVVVSCARRIRGFESRSHLGLSVRADEDGPTLVLRGVIERPQTIFSAVGERTPTRRIVVQIPLGDRASERDAFDRALAGYVGAESDFTWTVPASCGRVSTIGFAAP